MQQFMALWLWNDSGQERSDFGCEKRYEGEQLGGSIEPLVYSSYHFIHLLLQTMVGA